MISTNTIDELRAEAEKAFRTTGVYGVLWISLGRICNEKSLEFKDLEVDYKAWPLTASFQIKDSQGHEYSIEIEHGPLQKGEEVVNRPDWLYDWL